MVKALIYDYDGVISNSVNVKTEAFAELYRPYGREIEEKVINYHLANGGISRFEKFKYYHKNYLDTDLDEIQVDILSQKFSQMVLQKVIDASYVGGAYDFINRNADKYLQFICTGTPEEEIKLILEAKRIAHLFKSIYGSPSNKRIIASTILNKYKLKPEEVVFFGDASTDLDAALHCGIRFIGINSDQLGDDIEHYSDFTGLMLKFSL